MKNIHILPTDKPSRLYKLKATNKFILHPRHIQKDFYMKSAVGQNIYITSDKEIKEGDWCLYLNSLKEWNIGKYEFQLDAIICQKIILTDDEDLIKDGVQAIDDEFLEWFVKNPSCEWVDIETMMECEKCGKEHCDNLQCRGYKDIPYYKIIIPKEEPKQETLEEVGVYQQELFSYLHDLGIIALQSEMQEIERIVLSMQQQDKNKFSEEEVKILLQNIIDEIEVRKQNIISNSDKMSIHLLEGGCMAFESSQDAVKEQVEQFKNK